VSHRCRTQDSRLGAGLIRFPVTHAARVQMERPVNFHSPFSVSNRKIDPSRRAITSAHVGSGGRHGDGVRKPDVVSVRGRFPAV